MTKAVRDGSALYKFVSRPSRSDRTVRRSSVGGIDFASAPGSVFGVTPSVVRVQDQLIVE